MTIPNIFTTPGIGGIIAATVLLCAAATFFGLTYWVLRGGREKEPPWERMGWPYKSTDSDRRFQNLRR